MASAEHTPRVPGDQTSGRDLADVVGPIPRRAQTARPRGLPLPVPRLQGPAFRASALRSFGRLFTWLSLIAYVVGGTLLDRLRRQDTLARRALRLRTGLERAGGTLVKLGQQLAMRIDLLPWEYCVELARMLDRMPAFPVADALAAIERAAGRPWQEVFQVLDPVPVGSASIACVYQGILRDGTKVAVKVRRPGVGEIFMADLQVLDWVAGLAEFLTIMRPGITKNMRREIRDTLLEELDFRKEARYQEIFRRNAVKKAKQDFFTAPHVHGDLSSDEVLTQEFVSGMWLWEVIGAIEQNDPDGLAMIQRLGIDPALLARRILWVIFWSGDENLFFHADPHPANIVVGPGNTLTFVDFGSCGSFDQEQRWALEQMVISMRRGDAGGIARGAVMLLQPVMPVDVPAMLKEMEEEYTRLLHVFRTKAKHTEWWERTSMRQWLGMVMAAQRFGLPMNLHTLRMVRATLLYDTLVLRLDGTIDRFEEYARFRRRHRARWARKRWESRMRRFARDLPLALESLVETGEDVVHRAQHALGSPVLLLRSVVDKWAFTVGVLSRMVGRLLLITGVTVAAVATARAVWADSEPVLNPLQSVLRNRAYLGAVVVVVLLHVRLIVLRLRDRDSRPTVRVSSEPGRS